MDDKIGSYWDWRSHKLAFAHNGSSVGTAFENVAECEALHTFTNESRPDIQLRLIFETSLSCTTLSELMGWSNCSSVFLYVVEQGR